MLKILTYPLPSITYFTWQPMVYNTGTRLGYRMTMDRRIDNKGLIPKKYWGFILGGMVVVVIIAMALMIDGSSAYRVERQRLMISEVMEAPYQDYINVRGRVEPAYLTYLDAVEGGIVERIMREEGAMVKAGDTLLVLSNLNLSLNILNSEAQLAEKANFLRETQISMEQQKLALQRELLRLDYDLMQMERKYGQNRIFYQDQMISQNEFLESEEAYNMALKLQKLTLEQQQQDSVFRRTQVSKIRQNLENMERNLELIYQRQDHLVVKVPVDGQLASLNAVMGLSILPGQRLGQVNVLSKFKLQASIDEHYIDRVHKGLSARLDRQNEVFELTVTKVYPEVNEGQFLVDLTFDEAVPDKIRSGQTYNLNLQLGDTQQAILIERGGFFQSTGGRWVYVLNEDGEEAVKQPISIGRQNPKYYEVLEGLKPGDRVVISGYELFGDSEKLILAP